VFRYCSAILLISNHAEFPAFDRTVRTAERFWKKWHFRATHSRLEPVKKAAKTFKEHLYGILNHALYPISNGMVEGINSKIETTGV
jgi:transposase